MTATIEKVKGHLPTPLDFKLSMADWKKIGKEVVKAIVGNVRSQQTSTGGRLKENALSTKKRKRAKGRLPFSLRDDPDTYRFSEPGSFNVEADVLGVTVYPEDLTVSRYVQKMGYRGWMRPNAAAWEKIMAIVEKAIIRARGQR